jgi:DNA ligase D-like protein (predicted 3'-phosphoesterase)
MDGGKLKGHQNKMGSIKKPESAGHSGKTSEKEPIFVIQKHYATNIHYDLRLEIEGVLASWAVPKGPPLEPRTKRLAVRTEDHQFEYASFEGVIPEGQYGAGKVTIWDKGTYINLREKKKEEKTGMVKSLKEGKIEVWIKGEKIKGGYYLIRTGIQREKEQWLLIKAEDKEEFFY